MDFFLLIGIVLGVISVVVGMIVKRGKRSGFDQPSSSYYYFR